MVNGNDANREFVVVNPHRKAPMRSSSSSTTVSVTSSSATSSPQKNFDEMSRLRKLVSLSYYSSKFKGLFHREDRDTIVCEEDEEAFRRDNFREIVGSDDFSSPAASFVSNSAKEGNPTYTTWADSSSSSNAVSAMRTHPTTPSIQDDACIGDYEPSKEQRWCTNCAKCFQRKLSHYDQFCGLDCKTAHRFRLAA
jgi:hypothetical protein